MARNKQYRYSLLLFTTKLLHISKLLFVMVVPTLLPIDILGVQANNLAQVRAHRSKLRSTQCVYHEVLQDICTIGSTTTSHYTMDTAMTVIPHQTTLTLVMV
jgi:hypothetical protein